MAQIRGIDISKHQGAVDWAAVDAAGIDFALIRAGYGDDISQKDPMFETNIKGALARGLDVGVYWFSYADSVEDAQREAAVFRQVIGPYRSRITYPAAFDYEYASVDYYKKVKGAAPPNGLVDQMANAFLAAMRSNGWLTALYTNNDYRKNMFSAATLAAWDLWLADYSGGPDVPCAIQQTGSRGTVPGIAGPVDLDVSFKDYAALSAKKTAVWIDTTGTFLMRPGEFYTIKTTCAQAPSLWSGTDGVVGILHCRRDGSDDFWHVHAVGAAGTGTGIYTAAPGEQGLRRLVINVVDKK